MRYLRVTSPLMHGADVKEAQESLHAYHPGRVDGEYGPHTAAACRRAQYWEGYKKRNINGVYGPPLEALLTGAAKRSNLQRARRALREKMNRDASRRLKMLALARTQVGTEENPPGSNNVLYSRWYGLIGPWCAMFVSWCAHGADLDFRYSYVPSVVSVARDGGGDLHIIPHDAVRPGDLACYDWPPQDGIADHIGIVASRVSPDGAFTAIEGNTSASGSQDNGGEVLVQSRSTDLVQVFVRIGM